MHRPSLPRSRPRLALALLTLAVTVPLVDELAGGSLVDTPVLTLAAAASGLLAGAWLRPPVAIAGCLAGAALLTVANQRAHPGDFSAPNDLFFFALLLGGPALFGALLLRRHDQVRRLRQLAEVRSAQRAAHVRAARLEERHRVTAGVARALMQRIGGLVVQAAGARQEPPGESTGAALERIETTGREALDELRGVLGSLRAPEPASPGTVTPAPRDAVLSDPPRPVPAVGRLDVLVGACGVPVAFEAVASAAARGPAWANVVAGLALGAPLVLRRRAPVAVAVAVFVLAAAMSAVLTPLPATVTVLVPLSIAAYAIGDRARGWRRPAGVLVLGGGLAAVVAASPQGSRDPGGIAPTLVWLGLAVGAGALAAGRARRAAALAQLVREIEAGRDDEVRLAVAEQRQAIARDLHDSVAHAMTVVCLHAGAAQRQGGDAVGRALATIEATVRDVMAELRHGLAALAPDDHSAGPDGAGPYGADPGGADPGGARRAGPDDLARAVGDVAAGLGVRIEVDASVEVPSPATAALALRVAREALVNVARHAPSSSARVRLLDAAPRLLVEITNDVGANDAYDRGTGTGLRGLAALVRDRGGRFEHGAAHGVFRVAAYLPAQAEADADAGTRVPT